MLVALSLITGQRVMADRVERKHPCRCPECQEFLIHKTGRIVTWHFAHQAHTACTLPEGESLRHLQMKQQLIRQFEAETEIEAEREWVPGRRAGLVLPRRDIVIECQASPIPIAEREARTRDYTGRQTAVMRVRDIARAYGSKEAGRFPFLAEEGCNEQLIDAHREWRVPAGIRYTSQFNANEEIFVLDRSGQLASCELREAGTRYREWYDEYGDLQESDYTPKTLKRIIPWPVDGRLEHDNGQFRLVRFNEEE